jgi:hypothetical protein
VGNEAVSALARRWNERFTSALHEPRLAAILGLGLATTFGVCFVTGVLSHLTQNEPSWFAWPTRPAGLYRITQGTHVLTGAASIPLLLAKLWVVYPHFTAWPPLRSIAHAVERLTILPLVGGAIFLLFSGTANVARWYPWPFFFPRAHYWMAWVTIGGLIVHVGAKFTVARHALSRQRHESPDLAGERRRFLAGVGATSAVLFLATAGGTIRPLSRLAALAQRIPDRGPQGVPINKSAAGAGVVGRLDARTYRLVVDGNVARPLALSLDELRAMPMREATLPIACVEGWSASARWRGVPVRDLMRAAGAEEGAEALVESVQRRGLYRTSTLNRGQVADADTLLALEINGEPLHIDHGWPVRLIGPNRPGVLQTKWVERVVVR